jgi:hypothetical protein
MAVFLMMRFPDPSSFDGDRQVAAGSPAQFATGLGHDWQI